MVEISLIPKKERKPLGIKSIIWSSGTSLVILAILISGGLFFYKKDFEMKLQELSDDQKNLDAARDEDFEKKILWLKQDIGDAKILISRHLSTTKLWDFMERHSHPQVQFLSATAKLEEQKISAPKVVREEITELEEVFGGTGQETLEKRPKESKRSVLVLEIEALAKSFQALDGQLAMLKEEPGLEKVEISGIGFEKEGRVKFFLKLQFTPEFLKYEPKESL